MASIVKRAWLIFAAVLVASVAPAGQVPNPINAPASIAPGHIYTAGGNPQQSVDGGTLPTINLSCGGVDDTAAFTAAAALGSVVVALPPTKCVVSAATAITASGALSLAGQSNGTSVIQFKSGTVFPGASGSWLTWSGRVGVKVTDITFDLNGVSISSGLYGLLGFGLGSNIHIERNRIINGGSTGFVYLDLNGSTDVWVKDNYINQPSSYTTLNEGILTSCSAGAPSHVHIRSNTIINTGTDFCGIESDIEDNDINGWAFGAGITTEQDPNSNTWTIAHNRIHDGATTLDSNGTASIGVEDWGANDKVIGNAVWSTGGDGFDIGGVNETVIGNTAYNNGKHSTGSGFVTRYGNSTYNGNGSTYSGNVAYDNATGSQVYGYADQNASVANVYLAPDNAFEGATSAVNFSGTHSPIITYIPMTFPASGVLLTGSSTGKTTLASANASATNYTMTVPAANDTLVTLAATQTLTNKTLTSPTISGGTVDNACVGCTTPAQVTGTTVTGNTGVISGSGDGTASPVGGQAVRAPNGAGTNIAGATLDIVPGNGTGSATGGSVIFYYCPAGTTGTTPDTCVEAGRYQNNNGKWLLGGASGSANVQVLGDTVTASLGALALGSSTGAIDSVGGFQSTGTKFTTSGCSVSATAGGADSGTYTSGTTGTCTVVVTINGATGSTAANGWYCSAFDRTTPADAQQNTASTTTTATISGTTVTGDVIAFSCKGY